MGILKKLIVMLLLLFHSMLYAGTTCHVAATAGIIKRADLASCFASTDEGGVITVDAGTTDDWTTTLTLTKALTIQGAGKDLTIFKAADGIVTNNDTYMFAFNPTTTSATVPFELKGVTIDQDNQKNAEASPKDYGLKGIGLYNTDTVIRAVVKIHDCKFINQPGNSGQAIAVWGETKGVIYNNEFIGTEAIIQNLSTDVTAWANFTWNPGSVDNLYFEDNIFETDSTIMAGGRGGNYTFRYNTATKSTGTWTPIFDTHGNMNYGGNVAMMGVEIYGNDLISNSASALSRFGQFRGGQHFVYLNRYTGAYGSSVQTLDIREEYPDQITTYSGSYIYHVNNSYFWTNYMVNNSASAQTNITQNVCDSTIAWEGNHAYTTASYTCYKISQADNRCYKVSQSGTSMTEGSPTWCETVGCVVTDGTVRWVYQGTASTIAEDVDFFQLKTGFDGTSGMGCGTLANRPTCAGGCTTGVGYWVPNSDIDPNAASCANPGSFTGTEAGQSLVGKDNTLAASVAGDIGKLYTWSGSAWVEKYTPYTYPHPLRGALPNGQFTCPQGTCSKFLNWVK